MRMPDIKMPDLGNLNLDSMHMDDTTSIVIFVVIGLLAFSIIKKLFRFAILIGLGVGLFYILQ